MKGREGWTPELLRQMYAGSSPAMRAVLEYLATRPDGWATYSELNKVISSEEDRNVGKLGSTLGPFTRLCRDRYGLGWPFENMPSPSGGMRYRMDARVAEALRAYAHAPRQNDP